MSGSSTLARPMTGTTPMNEPPLVRKKSLGEKSLGEKSLVKVYPIPVVPQGPEHPPVGPGSPSGAYTNHLEHKKNPFSEHAGREHAPEPSPEDVLSAANATVDSMRAIRAALKLVPYLLSQNFKLQNTPKGQKMGTPQEIATQRQAIQQALRQAENNTEVEDVNGKLSEAILSEFMRHHENLTASIATNRDAILNTRSYESLLEFRALNLDFNLGVPESAKDCILAVLEPGDLGNKNRPEDFTWNHVTAIHTALKGRRDLRDKIPREIRAIQASAERRFEKTASRLRELSPEMQATLENQIQAFTKATEAITTDKRTQTVQHLVAALQCSQALDAALMPAEPENTTPLKTTTDPAVHPSPMPPKGALATSIMAEANSRERIKSATNTAKAFATLYRTSQLLPGNPKHVTHTAKGELENLRLLHDALKVLKKTPRTPADMTEHRLAQFRETLEALTQLEANVKADQEKLTKAILPEEKDSRESITQYIADLSSNRSYQELLRFRDLNLGIKPNAQRFIEKRLTPSTRPKNCCRISPRQTLQKEIDKETAAIKAAAWRRFAATRHRLMWLSPSMKTHFRDKIQAFMETTNAITNKDCTENFKAALQCNHALHVALMIKNPNSAKRIQAATATRNAFTAVYQASQLLSHTVEGELKNLRHLHDKLEELKGLRRKPLFTITEQDLAQFDSILKELPQLQARVDREHAILSKAISPGIRGIRETLTQPLPASYNELQNFRALGLVVEQDAEVSIQQVLKPGDMGDTNRPQDLTLAHVTAMQTALVARKNVSHEMTAETTAIKAEAERIFSQTKDRLRRLSPEIAKRLKDKIQDFTEAEAAITNQPSTQTHENFNTALHYSRILNAGLIMAEPSIPECIQTATTTLKAFATLYQDSQLRSNNPANSCIPHTPEGAPENLRHLYDALERFKNIPRTPTRKMTEQRLTQLHETLEALPDLTTKVQKDLDLLRKEIPEGMDTVTPTIKAHIDALSNAPAYKRLKQYRDLNLEVKPIAENGIQKILKLRRMTDPTRSFEWADLTAIETASTAWDTIHQEMAKETATIIGTAEDKLTATHTLLGWLNLEMRAKLKDKIQAFTEATDAITEDNRTPENLQTALDHRQALNEAVSEAICHHRDTVTMAVTPQINELEAFRNLGLYLENTATRTIKDFSRLIPKFQLTSDIIPHLKKHFFEKLANLDKMAEGVKEAIATERNAICLRVAELITEQARRPSIQNLPSYAAFKTATTAFLAAAKGTASPDCCQAALAAATALRTEIATTGPTHRPPQIKASTTQYTPQ